MKVNLCLLDRVVRAVSGVVLIGTGLLFVRGLLGMALDVVGALLLLSSATGFCHVYKTFGDFSTIKKL